MRPILIPTAWTGSFYWCEGYVDVDGTGNDGKGGRQLTDRFTVHFQKDRIVAGRDDRNTSSTEGAQVRQIGMLSRVNLSRIAQKPPERDVIEQHDIEDAVIDYGMWSDLESPAEISCVRDGDVSYGVDARVYAVRNDANVVMLVRLETLNDGCEVGNGPSDKASLLNRSHPSDHQPAQTHRRDVDGVASTGIPVYGRERNAHQIHRVDLGGSASDGTVRQFMQGSEKVRPCPSTEREE